MEEFNPTHKGLMFGVVPVYLDMTDEECPAILGRNWFCEYVLLDFFSVLFNVLTLMLTRINPEFEPMFPIKITGEL
jgi:hypothetical protein